MSKLSNIRKSIIHIVGGDFLTRDFFKKNIVFIITLVIVAIGSITYNNNFDKQLAEIDSLRRDLRLARYQALHEMSEVARIGKQEEIERRLQAAGIDIRVTDQPVFYIERTTRRR